MEQTTEKSAFARTAPIVGIACALIALVADLAYLHVETRRQAQVICEQAEQIDALCEWAENVCAQAAEDGKQADGFGRRIMKKFRAVGKKTVDAFHRIDDKMNPQAEK